MSFIHSPLNYTGGKFKILEDLFQEFPNNISTFVDLFAGGFNVGLNVNANRIICNDINSKVIEIYEYFYSTPLEEIQSTIDKIITEFNLSIINKEGYLKLRDYYNKINNSPVVLFVLIRHSFNYQIRFNKSGEFNMPIGKQSFTKNDKDDMIAFIKRLKSINVEFSKTNFLDFNTSILTTEDFVYCDPPYLISEAVYNGIWNEELEKNLLNFLDGLNNLGVKFALSNVLYHKDKGNDLLIDWSKNYNVININKLYDNCSYHLKDKLQETSEVLITNYKRESAKFESCKLF